MRFGEDPSFPIDFVVYWVDGSDNNWLTKKNERMGIGAGVDTEDSFNAKNRYRDFGLFKYWFRAVEKNAPWVHKVYLVTDNQVPTFLNSQYDKVKIIDHKQIISSRYLPTFDSSAIELNLHKIPEIADHFVMFNDDFFINQPVHKRDFFTKDGKAKDTVGQSIIMPTQEYDHMIVNNVKLINNSYSKRSILRRDWAVFFNPLQGPKIFFLNFFLSVFPKFTRLYDPHTAVSIIKSDMEDAASKFKPSFLNTLKSPFRSNDDISIQVIRYYQIMQQHVAIRNVHFANTANTDNPERVKKLLFSDPRTKIVNVNDEIEATDIDLKKIVGYFEARFSNKSMYEKDK